MIKFRGRTVAGLGSALFCISLVVSGSANATPRAAIAVVEVLGVANPDHVALRDGTFSAEISIGDAFVPVPAATAKPDTDPKHEDRIRLQKLKLGDELAVAVQKALVAKGLASYITGEANHPWPTSSLQLSIEDTRYERRVDEKIGPNLFVRFRLYDASSRDRLLSNSYVYDMYSKSLGSSIIRPPAGLGFDRKEELQAHPEVILAAMRKGVDMIAEQIATDILADAED